MDCFYTGNGYPQRNPGEMILSCGGMGFIAYLAFIVLGFIICVMYWLGKRSVREIYYSFYPEQWRALEDEEEKHGSEDE